VVDICGDSGSAKTELMMNVVANYLTFYEDDAKIAYFDNDVKLDVTRLGVLLESRLSSSSSISSSRRTDSNRTVTDLLRRVIVFRCRNQIEFMASLFSLDARIQSGEIKLVMIDSWTAFLWDSVANRSASTSIGSQMCSWFRTYVQKYQLIVFGTTSSSRKLYLKFWNRIRSCRLHLRRVKTDAILSSRLLAKKPPNHEFEAGWSECSVRSGYVAKFRVVESGLIEV